MKYPYIGQCYSVIALFYAEGKALLVNDALGLDETSTVGDKLNLSDGVNITHEYLKNTYGEVQSPEHAEFIIELAELHGFGASGLTASSMCFEFSGDCNVVFYEIPVDIFANNEESKKITIPLPPKADKQELSEWPQVGDEVQTSTGGGVVVTLPDKNGMYVVMIDGCYRAHSIDSIKKPKTPEEELRDEIAKQLEVITDNRLSACGSWIKSITDALLNNKISGLNITKKV